MLQEKKKRIQALKKARFQKIAKTNRKIQTYIQEFALGMQKMELGDDHLSAVDWKNERETRWQMISDNIGEILTAEFKLIDEFYDEAS